MKVDLRWKVPNSNQLWVRWKKIEKTGNGIIKLKNPEFFGSVFSDCVPLDESGSIFIDLTKHFIVLIPKPYTIKMTWNKKISQDNQKCVFDEITLEDTELGHLSKLSDKDLILLDATDHTTEQEARGYYKVAFDGMLYKETLEPYDFSS